MNNKYKIAKLSLWSDSSQKRCSPFQWRCCNNSRRESESELNIFFSHIHTKQQLIQIQMAWTFYTLTQNSYVDILSFLAHEPFLWQKRYQFQIDWIKSSNVIFALNFFLFLLSFCKFQSIFSSLFIEWVTNRDIWIACECVDFGLFF